MRRKEYGGAGVHRFARPLRILANILMGICVCAVLVLCFLYRDRLTADQIAMLTPKNQFAAALLMILLFALKSFCVFIYCGILFAACGMIFPLPAAILVNTLGTVAMTSIPYLIGRKAGSRYIEKLIEKRPKMAALKEKEGENRWFLSFLVRLSALLPSDLVSAFFGASGMPYGQYLVSTVLGFVPMILAFSVMGMRVNDMHSPEFIISACAQIGIMLLSCGLYVFMRRKSRKRNSGERGSE